MFDSFYLSWRTRDRAIQAGRMLGIFTLLVVGSGLVSAYVQNKWMSDPSHPAAHRWESLLSELRADRRVILMSLSLASTKAVGVPRQYANRLRSAGIPFLDPRQIPDRELAGTAATRARYRAYYLLVPDISRKH